MTQGWPATRRGRPRPDWTALERWYRTPLGRRFARAEHTALGYQLPWLFGHHLLSLGVPLEDDPLALSRIAHRCRVDFLPLHTPDLLADPLQLPIRSNSVDVIILSHLLEYTAEPHAVLREVERVLIGEGHVLILGFNPASLWGLGRLIGQNRPPWDGHALGPGRLRDWLSVLGLDIVALDRYFYRPPLASEPLLERLDWLERRGEHWWPFWGGGYLLTARKRVFALTPIRPRWRPRRALVPGGSVGRCFHKD